VLTAWNGENGAYLDLSGGIRIYGLKYYGAVTDRVAEGLIKALDDVDHTNVEYVILVMHAGLEGVLPNYSATLTHSQLTPLREYVDYLAFGHIHKPFEREGWIFNPGSPETCGMDEVAWLDRGYYLVEVDTGQIPNHETRLVRNPRRPFHRLSLNVDAYESPEALYVAVEECAREEATRHPKVPEPVIELALEGVLAFDRHELDVKRFETTVEVALNALLVRITNRTVPTEYEIGGDESKTRDDVEREVVEDLVERDSRYRPAASDWAETIFTVKRMSLEGTSPERILDYLESRGQLTPD
jgi:DNA repair exonuclease SbcCD nuclease subunit